MSIAPVARQVHALAHHPLVRAIGMVGLAATASQLASVAVAPILARLYSVGAFGEFGVIVAFTNIAATAMLLGLNDAVIAAADDRDARGLAAACILVQLALCLPVLGCAWWFMATNRFGLGALPRWSLVLILPATLLLSMVSLLQSMLIRGRRFPTIAAAYVALGLARACGQMLGGVASLGFLGLAGGELLGRAASNQMMLRNLKGEVSAARAMRIAEIRASVMRYRHFCLFRTPSALASAVAVGAPSLLIADMFGAQQAGYFNLMMTMIMGPLALAQKAVGDVFLGHFAAKLRAEEGGAGRLLLIFTGLLLTLGLLMGITFWAAGGDLFALVFGERWRPAGMMAAAATPWIVTAIGIVPVSSSINAANRPELKILFDVTYLGAIGVAWRTSRVLNLSALQFVSLLAWLVAGALLFLLFLLLYASHRPRKAQLSSGPST